MSGFSHTTLQNVLFPACNNTCIKHYVFIVLFSFVCSVADCHKALYYLFLPCLIIGLSLLVCFFLRLYFPFLFTETNIDVFWDYIVHFSFVPPLFITLLSFVFFYSRSSNFLVWQIILCNVNGWVVLTLGIIFLAKIYIFFHGHHLSVYIFFSSSPSWTCETDP